MKCALFHKMIGDRLDGTIRPQDRARLEDHLKSCPECREVAADFQKIAAEARALPQEDPAEELWPAIRAGVAAARRARPVPAFAHPRFRWAWAAGLVTFGAWELLTQVFHAGLALPGADAAFCLSAVVSATVLAVTACRAVVNPFCHA